MAIGTTADQGPPALQRVRRTMVVVDLVESVRLMLEQEDEVVDRWRRYVDEVRTAVLPYHGGRLVKSLGDGMLLAFESVPPAVAAAFDLQRRIDAYNRDVPDARALSLRVGLHDADVIETELDLFGVGVNLTARLAALGRPGDIIASSEVRDRMVARLDAQVQDLGECYLKHIDQPCRAFRLLPIGDSRAVVLPAPMPLMPRLAVWPVQPGVGMAPDDALLRVVTDDLVAALARRPHMQVLSRLSVSALANRPSVLDSLEPAVRADYWVRGTLSARGDRRVLQLEMAERQSPVWAGHFEGRSDAVLGAAGSMAGEAADALCRAVFQRQAQQVHACALPNLPGYTLLLQAMSLLHHLSREDVQRSHEILDHLADRHPRAAEVQAWLAKWHFLQVAQSLAGDRVATVRAARQCLGRALDVEPANGLALAIEGHLHAFEDRSPQLAETHLLSACAAAPNEALAWLFLANVQALLGKSTSAVHALERAQAVSPFDPLSYLTDLIASIVHSAADHHEEALLYAQRSVAQNGLHLSSQIQLLFAQADAGHMDDARRTAARYLELRPGASVQRFIDHHFAIDTPLARRQVAALVEAGIPR